MKMHVLFLFLFLKYVWGVCERERERDLLRVEAHRGQKRMSEFPLCHSPPILMKVLSLTPGLVSSYLDGELANPCDPSFSIPPGTGVTGVHETPSLLGCWVRNSGHNYGASILNC